MRVGLAPSGPARGEIKLAVAAPMTGGSAAFGAQFKNGAQQAVEDINASGGVLAQKFGLSIGDDRADPKEGRLFGIFTGIVDWITRRRAK